MSDSNILSAIEEGRLTYAKQNLDSLLKKFPNKSYYWALNSYLLYASGKLNESIAQCKSLLAKTPSDLSSLSLLYDLQRKLGLFDEADAVYENAIKKYPSTDLILAYFDKALSVYNVPAVQKASMQLQKHAKSNRHYGVTSAWTCYLLAKQSPSDKSQSLYLGLASGIIGRLQPLQSNQERFVFAKILVSQKKHLDVVQLLGSLDHLELELLLLYLDALDVVEDWNALYDRTKKLLLIDHFDDLDTWKYLIKAAHKLGLTQDQVLDHIKFQNRNEYYANIYLCHVYETDKESAIVKYFDKFHAKPSCTVDLLNWELPLEFLDSLEERYSNLLQKNNLTTEEATTLVNVVRILQNNKRLTVEWSKILKFDNTELYDLYLISMIESLRSDPSTKNITRHIIQLQALSNKDSENYKLRVWLVNLYTKIGAATLASKTYEELKIKMIQQDVSSYKLALEATPKSLKDLIQIFRFYLTSDAEVEPFVKEAFDEGLFTKTEDFLLFGERLANSLSRHILITKILKTSRMLNSDYYGYFFRKMKSMKTWILSDQFNLHDNRDFDSEYNLGVAINPIPHFQKDKNISKEYVRLQYLKEFLITERDQTEVDRLLKLWNNWVSDPEYLKQLTDHEKHIFNTYTNAIKLGKLSDTGDKEHARKAILESLDFKDLKKHFLSTVDRPSIEYQKMIADSWELARVVQMIVKDTNVVSASKVFQNELGKTQSNLKFEPNFGDLLADDGIDATTVKKEVDEIENSLQMSLLKIR